MKKLSLTHFILAGAFLACAGPLNAKNSSAANPPAVKHQHEIPSEKLTLDNGVKWTVDRTTNANVINLKRILKGFDNGKDRSIKAYTNTGNDLQNGLSKMIKECRMQGPNHLALHKWLEPLLSQVTKLKDASTITVAAHLMDFLHLQLNRYNQFFKT